MRMNTSESSAIAVLKALLPPSHSVNTLKRIKLTGNKDWFGGRQKCVDLLTQIVANQSDLELLDLRENSLTPKQQLQIKERLVNPQGCKVRF